MFDSCFTGFQLNVIIASFLLRTLQETFYIDIQTSYMPQTLYGFAHEAHQFRTLFTTSQRNFSSRQITSVNLPVEDILLFLDKCGINNRNKIYK